MIEIKDVVKSYDDIKAVNNVSLNIMERNVFGLIGTNGAGKSTLLRILAGVIKADAGEIYIDGQSVFENTYVKKKIFYIPDEQYFFSGSTAADVEKFYADIYTEFDKEKFGELMDKFHLDMNRKISTFSKGMKKLTGILLGVSANTKYLICDETFDGLDPVMRQGIKKLFAAQMEDREFTPIIASHNLRELEDFCDYIGLLHEGGVILSKDLIEMKKNIHKLQFVPGNTQAGELDKLEPDLDIVSSENRGSLTTIIVRGDKSNILNRINETNPIFMEALPLSLEEIFICETGEVGYDIKNLIF